MSARGKTIKTTLGYLLTLADKYSPRRFTRKSLTSIFNYLPITSHLATSGQPTEQQLSSIKAAGYEVIINLAPSKAENALQDEAALVNGLAMEYIHIPVNFFKPSECKFGVFVEAMAQSENKKIWLHCAANMRVSAFLFRYRRDILKESAAIAKLDLDKIWQPLGVWAQFIK
ncbi:protein tyrosine phosphatase family protein [Porticoccaceae bacterium]|nr:protein tyrosine phosphatase family protein [Porticoccaceae bacterium]